MSWAIHVLSRLIFSFTVWRSALGRRWKDQSVLSSFRLHRVQRRSNIPERRLSMYQILKSLFLDNIIILRLVGISWSGSFLSRTNWNGSRKTFVPWRTRHLVDCWYYTISDWWIETRRQYQLGSLRVNFTIFPIWVVFHWYTINLLLII